jgi:hypothetical protein
MEFPISFLKAVELIDLDFLGLRLDGFRTDGTSNYLGNLNCQGQTWAAALRMPARGANLNDFLQEKEGALAAVAYLLRSLEGGLDVGSNCVLKFGGVSTLVENQSTQAFLREQHQKAPLKLVDEIGHRERLVQGLGYPDSLPEDARQYVASYDGPFYLSRGAPAWETLEEYPDLEEPVAHALAGLHLRTGSGKPIAKDHALRALNQIRTAMAEQADAWSPSAGTKEANALAKSMKKWSGAGDVQRERIIKRERFLRTAAGRDAYRSLFDSYARSAEEPSSLRSFSHGDSHGGNYIIVRYQYAFDQDDLMIDRVFLNEVFEQNHHVDSVGVEVDGAHSRVVVHKLDSVVGRSSQIARRKLHHEIHPIDLDSGTGTTEATKVLHLYDALLFSISLEHLTALFADAVDAREVLSHYYDGFAR